MPANVNSFEKEMGENWGLAQEMRSLVSVACPTR